MDAVLQPPPPRPESIGGLAAVCVDCADPPALAAFYAALLGAPIELSDEGAGLYDLDGPNIDFIKVPEPKAVKNRLHLDLRATDLEAAVELAISLGASLAPDVYGGDRWVVLRDPEGNEFCLLRPRADRRVRYWPPEPPVPAQA